MNKDDSKVVNTRTRSANRGKSIAENTLALTATKRKYRRKCSNDVPDNCNKMDKGKDDVAAGNSQTFNNDDCTEEDHQKTQAQPSAKLDNCPVENETQESDTSEEEDDTDEDKEPTQEQSCVNIGGKVQASDGHSDLDLADLNRAKSADQESDKKSVGEDSKDHDADLRTPSLDSDVGSAMSPMSESRREQRKKSHSQTMPYSRIDFKVGVRVEARDHLNMWYAAKIVQVDLEENEVLIHFERWSSRFDEWVCMDSPRLRAVARTSARKEKRAKQPSEHKVNEVVMAKWTDCKMYPAKILSMNPNGSYQVLFYDGFEKTVQRINVKRILPGEMAKVEFKCTPSTPSNLKEKRVRGPYKKRNSDKETIGSEKRKPRTASPPGRNEGRERRGALLGLPQKKQKLLVGGIFQAKRHGDAKSPPPPTKKRSSSLRSEKAANRNDDTDVVRPSKKSKEKPVTSHLNIETEKGSVQALELVSSAESKREEVKTLIGQHDCAVEGLPQSRKKFSVGVAAPKEFRIEADHNQHKCPIDGCGKGFRKEANLQSHMKHYHNDLSVSEADGRREEDKPRIEKDRMLKEALKSPPLEPGTVDIAVGDCQSASDLPQSKGTPEASRKLITEKRRQMLMEKRLENLRKKKPLETNRQNQLAKADGSKTPKRQHSSTSGKNSKPGAAKNSKGDDEPKRQISDEVEVPMKKKRRNDADNKSESSSPSVVVSGDSAMVVGHLVSSKSSKKKKDVNAIVSSMDSGNNFVENEAGTPLSDIKIKKEKSNSKMSLLIGKDLQMKVWNDDEREEVVNCSCGLQEEDGLMMQCEICLAWQHGLCFHIEEESKVPDNYVCYSCTNPKGLRKRCRYMHEQDWIRRGELASFKFLPRNVVDWKRKETIMKTHAIASQVTSIRRLLPSLHFKLNVASIPDHPDLKLWAEPWNSSYKSSEYRPGKVECKSEPMDLTNSIETAQPSCTFGDHSYSAPDRTRLPTVKLATELKLGNRSTDVCHVVASFESRRLTETWISRDPERPIKRECIRDQSAASCNDMSISACENISQSSEVVTNIDQGGLDFDMCRINLLDHIEQLQDEVDRRLDELGQLLDGIEADFESSSIATSGDFLADRARIKRMMCALLADLAKVRRMALYC